VNDPILLFLTVDAGALLLLGACASALPPAAVGFLATMASGMGMLLCLPPLLMNTPATTLELPIGPPGLSLHFALDPLSAFFLIVVFLAATAIAAFQANTTPVPAAASVRMTVFALAGAAVVLLAADGVCLAIGLAIMCGGAWLPRGDRRARPALLIPFLMLAAMALLAPFGSGLRFDAIHAAPAGAGRAAAAAALTIAAVAGLSWSGSDARHRTWEPSAHQSPTVSASTVDALAAGVLIPSGSYLLLRLIADLSGAAIQTWYGFVLLLGGGAVAVLQGWASARHPGIDGSAACLMRRQAGLAATGAGLALIARAADLPGAASFALGATFLSAAGGSVCGVLTSLAVHAVGVSAGTVRLSRLGGLVHTMPGTSAALSAGLLGLSAVPPGLGFAALWLLFEAVLSAPRTGGLVFQLPLALAGAGLALSAALATAAAVRLIGVAVLGRPRTPRGAAAHERQSPSRTILLVLAATSVLAGMLPGTVLWALAGSAIRMLTGAPSGAIIGFGVLSPSTASPNYQALPVFALVALATWAAVLVARWSRKEPKTAGPWSDGMQPPIGLPFGEPSAQSAGAGFLPALPDVPLPALPRTPLPRAIRPPSAAVGLWLVLAGFGGLLLGLALLE
jgi:hydrogenase-4 component B